MRLIGFNFTKISGKREEKQEGQVKVNHHIEIVSVDKEKIDLIKEDNVLKFSFKYIVGYEPKFASIDFEGSILLLLDDEKAKQVIKEWKKKKTPEDVRIPLFNIILSKCNVKALQLSDELGIPSHIPLPKIAPGQPQQDNAEYTG